MATFVIYADGMDIGKANADTAAIALKKWMDLHSYDSTEGVADEYGCAAEDITCEEQDSVFGGDDEDRF